MVHKGAKRKPGVYRDMEARRAYRRAWMAAARARASTKSGEAAARKKEPGAAPPQKSNCAIAAETGVAFKTVAARASGVPNDTPEKTIGLDGKSYPEGPPKIRIPNNWAPRNYQMNVWRYLERGGKRAICVWHRRAGKDDVCLHWAAASMIDKPATYWHMLPAFSQGRKAIWTEVNPHTGKRRIDEAFPYELRVNTNESEMFIRLKNGSTWQVVGSDRYDAAGGSSPAGITFSEWALSDPSAWAYLAPIVIETTDGRYSSPRRADATTPSRCSTWRRRVMTGSPRCCPSTSRAQCPRRPSSSSAASTRAFSARKRRTPSSTRSITAASRRPFSARTGARKCSSPSSRAASATSRSTLTCRFRRPGTSASTTPWPSGASRSTPITSTSWTITRATVRASTTIANGSTSGAITAPTGIRTT